MATINITDDMYIVVVVLTYTGYVRHSILYQWLIASTFLIVQNSAINLYAMYLTITLF